MPTETDHLRMMRNPSMWIAMGGFVLPMQHHTRKEPGGSGMGLLGFMLEDPLTGQAAPKVYVGCIYFSTMGQKLEDIPVEVYPSLEAVVAAGWEVN